MYKVGDRVKFLNDPGGGIITRIIGNEAYVQVEDGFEIPTLISNLIPDREWDAYSSSDRQTFKDTNSPEIPKIERRSVEVYEAQKVNVVEFANELKIFLAFVIEDQYSKSTLNKVSIYLINEGNYFFYYTLSAEIFQKRLNLGHGLLEPQLMINIGTFQMQQLHEYSGINVDILPFNTKSYKACPLIDLLLTWEEINIGSLTTYGNNDYFDQPARIIDIVELFELKKKITQLQKENIPIPKQEIKEKKIPIKDIEEVDLHIDKIVSNDQLMQLTASQILEIQIDRFTIALESALKSHIKRIVFIHGVGNGKLRYEIQKILRRKYPHLNFQDASFAEYGYGATMVILRK